MPSTMGHSIIETLSVGQIPAVCGECTILLPVGTRPLGLRCFPRPCQEQELKVLKQNYEKHHGSMGSMAMDPATHQRNLWFDFAFSPHDIGVISYHRQNRDSSHDISDNSEPWGDGHPQSSSTKVQEFFSIRSIPVWLDMIIQTD